MDFALIAACDKEMGIGKGGTLPWHLPGELAYFHRVTSEVAGVQKRNAVIMGRKTWESIPEKRRPLPGRLNCVITRDENYPVPDGVLRFSSLEECLAGHDKDATLEKAYIIGGGELFRQAIAMEGCEAIYLTEVEGIFNCDTFFPPLPQEFNKNTESEVQEENGAKYKFVVYRRQ